MLLVSTIMSAGCTVCHQTKRTICDEPLRFSELKDRKRSLRAYRDWAARVWKAEVAACGTGAYSDDYARGFSDGFSDFCYAGGSGEPPPIPPREFWNLSARSPDGHAAADDWFAGYRHGARAAREGGYRDRAIVHSSLIYPEMGEFAPALDPAADTPEDLGPPPMPGPEEEAIGPQFDNSNAPIESSVPSAPTSNENQAPGSDEPPTDESPDSLPPPITSDSDRTTQNSVRQFKSAMRNASEQRILEASLSVDDYVKPDSIPDSQAEPKRQRSAPDRAPSSILKLIDHSK
jgi:hypothetical protein